MFVTWDWVESCFPGIGRDPFLRPAVTALLVCACLRAAQPSPAFASSSTVYWTCCRLYLQCTAHHCFLMERSKIVQGKPSPHTTEQREAKKSNREEKEKFEKIFSNFEKRKRKGFHFSRFERRKRNFLNDSPLSRRERERDFIFSRFERRTRNSKYKFCKYEINFRSGKFR